VNTHVTVIPKIGYYLVTTVDHRLGVQTRTVDRRKRCSCGGTAKRPCPHIRAVANYLREGGERASEECPAPRLPEKGDDGPLSGTPTMCPICGTPVDSLAPDFWRCPHDPSHYWRWRGERSGVKDFLTKPHPAKAGAFYTMSREAREAFLAQATRRLHALRLKGER
jgi:hypothetical protein